MCLLVKKSFMKTLIGKNLGQIRKSVNPIGCLKRASEKQCLSMRNLLLYDEEPFAISMMQPDIAVKSTISCNRFLSLLSFFAFKHYETDNKHSPVILS